MGCTQSAPAAAAPSPKKPVVVAPPAAPSQTDGDCIDTSSCQSTAALFCLPETKAAVVAAKPASAARPVVAAAVKK